MPGLIPTEGSEDIPELAAEANKLNAASSDTLVALRKITKRLATICAHVYRLSKTEKAKFRELMELTDSQFSVYAKIGLNQHLWTPEVEAHLTGNVSIDYVTARFKPEEINAGIQQGIITIRTTRSEILKYQSKLRSENAPIKGAAIWAIKRTRALNRNERLALEDFLDKVFSAAFVDVKRPEVVATLKVKRPIRKAERKWFGDIRRQLVDLGYVEIDDKFGKAGLKHQEQQNDAVRDALKKAISNADSSSQMWSSEIANLPDRMIKTLLAPMGIDFDSLKAEAHKSIKEPALLSAVEKDQSAEAPAEEALPVETKRTDTGAESGKPPKE